jgi:hypothetical protein
MKTRLFTLSGLCFIILFYFVGCKKDQAPLNISLYDKPLSTIQSYVQGTWKLEYEKGGICSTCLNNFENKNFLWQFGFDNQIKQTFENNIVTDTAITWKKDRAYYINGDSAFNMNFYDKRGYPYNYLVDGIFNDTLMLHDNYAADVVYYYLTRVD